MLSKTLSFNRGIFVQAARSVGWIGVAYLILLLFAVPLQLIMVASRDQNYYLYQRYFVHLDTIFGVFQGFQLLLMFTVPVLLAIFVFRYLQVKLSADYIHSLPIRRESLYHQYITFSSIMLLVPVLITGLVLFILRAFLDVGSLLSFSNIVYWIAITTMFNLFVYFAGVLVAMLTGMSVLQGALIYIMLIFPAGITTLYFSNLSFYLFGFSMNQYISDNILKLLPIFRAGEMDHNPLTIVEIASYIAITIAFYLIALFVYRKRNIESATQAIAFRPLRPVFLYGVTFCSMLLGGLYFGATQDEILGWIIFGYLFASIIGYAVAQMILEKTWRIFDKWKGYLAFLLVAFVILLSLYFDVTGFENRIPDANQVEQVYFSDSFRYLQHGVYYYQANPGKLDALGKPFGVQEFFYQDADNIEHIRALHQEIINDKEFLSGTRSNPFRPAVYVHPLRTVAIEYYLANGSTITREYRVPYERYLDLYKPIMESIEYRHNNYPLLRVNDITGLETISIRSSHLGKSVVISDRNQLAELHEIIKSELLSMTVEEMLNRREPWGHIEYLWQGNRYISIPWNKTYENIDAWLMEQDLLEQTRYTVDDISTAFLIENVQNTRNASMHEILRSPNSINAIETLDNVIKLESKEHIEMLLPLTTWDDKGDSYMLVIYFDNSKYPGYHPIYEPISKEDVPDFIKN
ncbi:DUF6449 domain-containing protein [Desulfuribacillus alkaliarsenatis]|uniref:DUF6449 domain-containing protein n=1 Tax=Desulfuribacillus alkaliarsenatis TaxID=766136 RepID=A0A1E5G2Z2_9FIRM|nr:DUF6449 domain-containing protein [Desulfuribacillus alkaliarsenatis]OEF97442.1 hypothetical protein BHF68_04325 [Desulfuribacillus alkaliarsenatis]